MSYSKCKMIGYVYIEDGGQTYLQCQVEAKSFCKGHVKLFRQNAFAYDLRMSMDRLYKIPSRGVNTFVEKVYVNIETIILN